MQSTFLPKIRQSIATVLTLTLAFSLFIPASFAALNDPVVQPNISNLTMDQSNPYNSNSNRAVTFSYKLSGLGANVSANMTAKIVNGMQERILETQSHLNGTYEVNWDGKFPSGTKSADSTAYYFKVSGNYGGGIGQPATALTPKDLQFDVQAINPLFSQVTLDTPTYNITTDTDGLKCTYTLANLYETSQAYVTASIVKSDNSLVMAFPEVPKGYGSHSIVWDGKNSAAGSYKCKVEGKWNVPNGDTSLGIAMTMKETPFTVEKSAIIIIPGNIPTITQPTVNKNPYDYSNSNTVSFSYNYQNLNSEMAAAIYTKVGDMQVYKWPNATLTGAGTKTLNWNGINSSAAYVVDGDYYFKVWEASDNDALTKQVDFKVNTAKTTLPAITNLKATPATFYPGSNETTTISFDLNQNADVTILTTSPGQNGLPQMGAQTELYKASKNAGTVNFVWTGKQGSSLYANGFWPIIVKVSNVNGSDEETIYVNIATKSIGNTTCGGFTDVPDDLCPAFQFAKEKKIFLGDDNSTKVRPYDVINRVESAAVMLRSFDMSMSTASGGNEGFSDVNTTQSYMTSGTVRSAKIHGILKGYPDGTLKPAQQVINAELLTMFGRASGKTFPEVQTAPFLDTPLDAGSSWYIKYVNGAKVWGWISAGSYFNPTKGMTRGNVAKLIYDAHNAGLNIPGV